MKNRYIILGIVTLVLVIPLYFISAVIEGRERYSKGAADAVAQTRGGGQTLSNLMLVVPYEVEVEIASDSTAPQSTIERRLSRGVAKLSEVTVELETSLVRKGIFEVPVFTADYHSMTQFDLVPFEEFFKRYETVYSPLWQEAYVTLELDDLTTIQGAPLLRYQGQEFALRPLRRGVIWSQIGDPRGMDQEFDLSLTFTGSRNIGFAVAGQQSNYTLTSDWPHPILGGNIASTSYEGGDDGFSVSYSVPFLATGTEVFDENVGSSNFTPSSASVIHIQLIEAVGFYQKAVRLAKYSILFIALSFVIVLATEQKARPFQAIQFVYIALAQLLFPVLMVAYAEQLGFVPAYILASMATIGLISMYGYLSMGRHAVLLGVALGVLYILDFFIVSSMDYALISGSTLAFIGLAVAMFVTHSNDMSKGA